MIDLFGTRISRLDGWASLNGFEPALQMGKVTETLLLMLMRENPGIAGNVGNRILAGYELAITQPPIQNTIWPMCFIDVTLYGIESTLRSVLGKRVVLSSHSAKPSHLPMHPLNRFDSTVEIVG